MKDREEERQRDRVTETETERDRVNMESTEVKGNSGIRSPRVKGVDPDMWAIHTEEGWRDYYRTEENADLTGRLEVLLLFQFGGSYGTEKGEEDSS